MSSEQWSFASGVPTGLPPTPASRWSPGQVVDDRYLLLERLGQGGSGVVFRARELSSGRVVAVKLLGGFPEPRHLERLRREGALLADVQHPGVVRVHASGEAAGQPYLVCELVEGARPLGVAFQGLDLAGRVALVLETCRAVAAVHARGIVHRDLKSSNVLVDLEGRARVIDFGLAWHSGLGRLTEPGALVGTPMTMAPEQFQGGRVVGPPADVWALGVILYQALTGRLPFQAVSLTELAVKISSGRPRAPRSVDPGVPPALESVCLRALATDPAGRQPDAGALARELEAALEGGPAARAGRGLLALALAALAGTALATLAWPGRVTTGVASPGSCASSPPPHPELEGPTPAVHCGWARAALAEARAGRGAGPAAAARLLEGLLARPLQVGPASDVDPLTRAAAASWLLAEGWRAAALALRLEVPGALPAPGAPPADVQRRRARDCWEGALALDPAGPTTAWAEAALATAAVGTATSTRGAEAAAALAPDPRGVLVRAELLLLLGRGEEALAVLGPATPPAAVLPLRDAVRGRSREAAWRWAQARAWLAVGRSARAREALTWLALRDPLSPEVWEGLAAVRTATGDHVGALEARARLLLLGGARREQALSGYQRLRNTKSEQELQASSYRALLELDPAMVGAAFFAGLRSMELESELVAGIAGMLAAARRDVRYLPRLLRVLRGPASAEQEYRAGRPLAAARQDPGVDPRVRTVVGAILAERAPLALIGEVVPELDRWLEEDPGDLVAWALRARMRLLQGDTARAQEDLAVLRDEAPDWSETAWLGALHAAAGRAAPETVLAALARVEALEEPPWLHPRWASASFPELAPYRGKPGFEPLFQR